MTWFKEKVHSLVLALGLRLFDWQWSFWRWSFFKGIFHEIAWEYLIGHSLKIDVVGHCSCLVAMYCYNFTLQKFSWCNEKSSSGAGSSDFPCSTLLLECEIFFFFANKILVLLHPKTNCYTCSGSLTVKLNVEINVLIANLFCQNKPLVRIKKWGFH